MKNDFLNRILLERDYKISLLRENLDQGYLETDLLFLYLSEIATLQYRVFGHTDIINIIEESTVPEKLKSLMQSLAVLEKSISFIDGVVAALSANSMNSHLFTPYYGRGDEASIRDKILANGQSEILKLYEDVNREDRV